MALSKSIARRTVETRCERPSNPKNAGATRRSLVCRPSVVDASALEPTLWTDRSSRHPTGMAKKTRDRATKQPTQEREAFFTTELYARGAEQDLFMLENFQQRPTPPIPLKTQASLWKSLRKTNLANFTFKRQRTQGLSGDNRADRGTQ